MLTAATLAWARSLGEFGPILVFSGATRMRTEVLPTSVFLELSIGNIEAAVAVSLMMIVAALAVLTVARTFGLRAPLERAVGLVDMIAVENLTVRAGKFALEGVSFEVPQGQYGVLMGKTGSGKTTLLEAICGLKPRRRRRDSLWTAAT